MQKKYIVLLLLGMLIFPLHMKAQEITKDDYQRAVSFMYANYNNKTVFNLYTQAHWFEDNSGLWFLNHSKDGKAYKTVSFSNYEVTPLFDHQSLTNQLNTLAKDSIKASDISIRDIEKKENGVLAFSYKGTHYLYNNVTKRVTPSEEKEEKETNVFESKSPDGRWIAYTEDYNLFIKSTENEAVYQLSFDGKKNYEYASWYGWYDKMEGEQGERPKRFFVNWSEDSQWISTSVVDLRNAEKMYLLDWSIDSLYKPKLLSYYRGSPGDTNMVRLKPIFFNVALRKEIEIDLPSNTHINNVSTQFLKQSGMLVASYAQRGYQKETVLKVDLNAGTTKPLITETSTTNIDNFSYWNLEEKNKLVFLSERSGWRQLYTVDIVSGEIKALTKGSYVINSIEHIDKSTGWIYFLASGKEKGNNPYHQQLYKVDLDGNTRLLTSEKTHHRISFSEDGTHFVDNFSTSQAPTQTVLREAATGNIVARLTQADASIMTAKGWKTPEVFQLKAKDGKTTIYGALWKPTNFDSNKKYPIIDHSYTGPHTQMFPKSYDRGFMNQSLAELGFVVMMVDGLGTSGRSKAFHDHSYKNMGNNLEDHVLAIKYLSETFDWIDGERVGVFGHSAGGYDTGRAMLGFPEIYKVGVASSADHDFRMEKAWWPEMYMGWPVDESYEEVSNITNAANLQGKLLITHGGIDDNVNPSATFKLAEALINADKEFDLVIFPSQRHGYTGKHRTYFIKKRWNYFVEHLRETKPIWDFKWE